MPRRLLGISSRAIRVTARNNILPIAILIYSLSEKELEALREYIDKNLIKKYIKSSKLLTRYTILFISKKNGKLRIYVDYKKLNNIIIKNRYTLSLIYEI
jgi:hypothetical protein